MDSMIINTIINEHDFKVERGAAIANQKSDEEDGYGQRERFVLNHMMTKLKREKAPSMTQVP